MELEFQILMQHELDVTLLTLKDVGGGQVEHELTSIKSIHKSPKLT